MKTDDSSDFTQDYQKLRAELAELKRSFASVNARADRLNTIVDEIPDALFLQTADGVIVDLNRQACEFLGYDRTELIGKRFSELDPDQTQERLEWLGEQLQVCKTAAFESRQRRKDGTTVPVEVRIRAFERGSERFALAQVRNTTEKQRAEKLLQESEAKFRSYMDNAPVAVLVADETGRFLEGNRTAAAMLGYAPADLVGLPVPSIHPEEDRDQIIRTLGTLAQQGRVEDEYRMKRRDGSVILVSLRAVRLANGHSLGYFEDITAQKETETALRAERDRFASIVSTVPLVICTFRKRPNGSWCFPFANPRLEQIYGLSPASLEEDATPIFDRIHPDDVGRILIAIEESAQKMTPWRCEYRVRNPAVGEIWVEGHAVPQTESDGGILWQGYIADVTHRKRAEEALRESEERLRLFVEHAPAALAMFDYEMRYLVLSRRWRADYALSDADYFGQSHYDVFPDLPEKWKEVHRRGLAGEIVRNDEDRFVRANGSVQWIRWEVRPWYRTRGTIGGIVIFAEDISERKRTENALHESERRLLLAQQVARIGTFEWNIQTGVNTWTPELESLYGLPAGEFCKTQNEWEQLIHPLDRAASVQSVTHAFETGIPTEGEWRVIWPDGSVHWIAGRFQVIRDETGKPLCLTGVNQDITDRKQAEAALLASEARYRTLFDYAPDGILICDPQTRYLDANASICRMLGYSREELIGLHGSDVVAESEIDQIEPAVQAIQEQPEYHREWLFRRKDGSTLEVDIIATVMPDGNLLALVRDVTERKLAEETLRDRERLLGIVTGSARVGLVMIGVGYRYLFANEAYAEIFGLDTHEIVGRHVWDLLAAGWPQIQPRLDRAFAGERVTYELTLTPAPGIDGARFFSVVYEPRSSDCNVTTVVVVVVDITNRKRAEDALRQANADLESGLQQLAQANRELSAKTQENEAFVYSVSHDLRSPLVNLHGFSKELGRSAQDLRSIFENKHFTQAGVDRGLLLLDGGIAKSLGFINSAVARLGTIIDALLRLSRAGRVVYQKSRVDMREIVARIVASLDITRTERRATIQLGELPPAFGDPAAIEQIFANLVGNALNYLDSNRPGFIEVGSLGRETSDAPGLCTYFVRDNGMGISETGKAKLFQPFQRLHPRAARGKAWGLAIVKRVVERHGGRIWFESTVGQGTTFYIELPVCPEALLQAGCLLPADSKQGGLSQ